MSNDCLVAVEQCQRWGCLVETRRDMAVGVGFCCRFQGTFMCSALVDAVEWSRGGWVAVVAVTMFVLFACLAATATRACGIY